jgi:hypothetical protein
MTLRPTDMLEIQSAIDEYERKFPRRPAPSAEVALAWRLGKREYARRVEANPDLAFNSQKQAEAAPKRPDAPRKQPEAAQKQAEAAEKRPDAGRKKADAVLAEQECNRAVWALQQFRLQWQTIRHSADQPPRYSEFVPWVKTALLVGWWGAVAVLVASVFIFGALVGGFK